MNLQDLATASPLHAIDAAIAARLLEAFPAKRFHHGIVPAKLTQQGWQRLTRNTPFVGRGWTGIKPRNVIAGVFAGEARWTVWLVQSNSDVGTGALERGDSKPGLYGMAIMAAMVLEGLRVPEVGTLAVEDLQHLFSEEWGDENTGLVGINLTIPVNLLDVAPPGEIDDFLRLGVTWPGQDNHHDELTVRTP